MRWDEQRPYLFPIGFPPIGNSFPYQRLRCFEWWDLNRVSKSLNLYFTSPNTDMNTSTFPKEKVDGCGRICGMDMATCACSKKISLFHKRKIPSSHVFSITRRMHAREGSSCNTPHICPQCGNFSIRVNVFVSVKHLLHLRENSRNINRKLMAKRHQKMELREDWASTWGRKWSRRHWDASRRGYWRAIWRTRVSHCHSRWKWYCCMTLGALLQ